MTAFPSQIDIPGSVSGSVLLRAADAAGSGTIFQLPSSNGSNGYYLKTDGNGVTSWASTTTDGSATLQANTFTRGQTFTLGTANESLFSSTGYSVTGAGVTPMIYLRGTLNTSGNVPIIDFDITNTASGAATQIFKFYFNGAFMADLLTAGTMRAVGFACVGGSLDLNASTGTSMLTALDGTGTIAQRAGTTSQSFRVYNTWSSASNYERFVLDWKTTSNTLRIGTEAQTGTVRDISFVGGVVTFASGTATPAGGSTAASIRLGTTAALGIYYGSGAPTVSAAQSSIYMRTDGSSTSTRMYINTDGSTGWTNVVTAA